MSSLKTRASLLLILSLGLAACVSNAQKMMQAGATRLNGDQVRDHITGMTERWARGGGYYDADGSIEVVWKGKKRSGTYEVSDDGEVCYQVADWKKYCHHYLDDNGRITLVYRDNPDLKEMMPGNKLSEL